MSNRRSVSQLSTSSLDRLSWDSLRMLLALDEAGSFRAAASVAGVSLNTMRTKIDRLEHQFCAPLLRRSVEGVTLTQEGRELVSIVRQMRQLGTSAKRVSEGAKPRPRDLVRIAATEGIGTYWLVPQLAGLSEQHSNLRVHLTCNMASLDVLFRDVDIAVQLIAPESTELVSERVGTMHVMPFASERYLRQFGTPHSITEAADHRLVWQVTDQLPIEMLSMFIESSVADRIIALQTNTSSAHYLAVAKGVGIGLLPTYTRALSKAVRPIDIGINLRHGIYVIYHRSMEHVPEVRAGIDWLRAAFNPETYPWFAEDFIHPTEFDRRIEDGVVLNLFEGISAP